MLVRRLIRVLGPGGAQSSCRLRQHDPGLTSARRSPSAGGRACARSCPWSGLCPRRRSAGDVRCPWGWWWRSEAQLSASSPICWSRSSKCDLGARHRRRSLGSTRRNTPQAVSNHFRPSTPSRRLQVGPFVDSVFDGYGGAFEPGQTTPKHDQALHLGTSVPTTRGCGLSDGDGEASHREVRIDTVGEFCPWTQRSRGAALY